MLFLELPAEALSLVLHHVLPDLIQSIWSKDPYAANSLFVQPVLQVCQVLRFLGHAVINARDAWITVDIRSNKSPARYFDLSSDLPILSPYLHCYLKNAATFNLELDFIGPGPEAAEHVSPPVQLLHKQIYPFNLQTWLRIWEILESNCGRRHSVLTMRCQNMHRHVRTAVCELGAGAMALVGCSYSLPVKYSGGVPGPFLTRQRPGFEDCPYQEKTHIWLMNITRVLEEAKNLAEKGYDEEPGWLLLGSESLLGNINQQLQFGLYYAGLVVETSSAEFVIVELAAQPLALMNQLRKLCWYIHQGAVIAAARLFAKHGTGWGSEHGWIRGVGPDFHLKHEDWFGATRLEWALLHLRTAVLMHAASKERGKLCGMDKEGLRTPALGISDAVVTEIEQTELVPQLREIIMASCLDPQNLCIQRLKEKFSTMLGAVVTAEADAQAKAMFRKQSCVAYQVNGTKVDFEWEGDTHVLRMLGTHDQQRYLLMQEGIPEYPEYAAHLEQMTRAYIDEVTR